MIYLNELLPYETIVIQCHDNPDADAIASGYALYNFFKLHKKTVRLIYSGNLVISKPNLKLMLEELNIPLEYTQTLTPPDLLITVDCQYKSSNVTIFEAHQVCILDHHIYDQVHASLYDIRPYLTSCSTLIWELLKGADFPLNNYPLASTALYYGLLTDSNFFSELRHPLDKDLLDTIYYDKSVVRKLKNSNLSFLDLETAGIALIRCSANKTEKFAVLQAHACDPNILGFISDLAIQVDTINFCIVYFHNEEGIKYSIRSCCKEVNANEFAIYICRGMGSAGGHADKAGGFIHASSYEALHNSTSAQTYFHNITATYLSDFRIIYGVQQLLDKLTLKRFHKQPLVAGYTALSSLFDEEAPVVIRTIHGDVEINPYDATYLVLSQEGSIHLFTETEFEERFQALETPYQPPFEYQPIIKNTVTGSSSPLGPYLHACLEITNVSFFGAQVNENIKLFKEADSETYLTILESDFIYFEEAHPEDLSIVSDTQFHTIFG